MEVKVAQFGVGGLQAGPQAARKVSLDFNHKLSQIYKLMCYLNTFIKLWSTQGVNVIARAADGRFGSMQNLINSREWPPPKHSEHMRGEREKNLLF